MACAVVAATTRVARHRRSARPGSVGDQFAAALRLGWRDGCRNPVLWVLLAVVPAVFILLADAITPARPAALTLVENGRRFTETVELSHIHAGTMAPIAIASLATLAGLFTVLDARITDQRLVLAGLRAGVLLAARLAVIIFAAGLASVVSLAVTATVFDAHQWGLYAAANALLATTYGLLGAILGPRLRSGRRSVHRLPRPVPRPRHRAEPDAQRPPGYGGSRVLIDASLTAGFDETRSLLIAVGWLATLLGAAALLLRCTARRTT